MYDTIRINLITITKNSCLRCRLNSVVVLDTQRRNNRQLLRLRHTVCITSRVGPVLKHIKSENSNLNALQLIGKFRTKTKSPIIHYFTCNTNTVNNTVQICLKY